MRKVSARFILKVLSQHSPGETEKSQDSRPWGSNLHALSLLEGSFLFGNKLKPHGLISSE